MTKGQKWLLIAVLVFAGLVYLLLALQPMFEGIP